MTALLFVLLWIALGVGVVLIGLASRRGDRDPLSATRRRRRFGLFTYSFLALVIGAAIPAAVVAGSERQKDIPRARVTGLDKQQKHGRQLFGRYCGYCHTLKAAEATGRVVGPNLDDLRPSEPLILDAIKNGRAAGNGQMPVAIVQGEDARDVAKFVAQAVGTAK